MVTVVLTVFSVASLKMHYNIKKCIRVRPYAMRAPRFAFSSFVPSKELSPSVAFKRKFLAVDVTVSPACPEEKGFKHSAINNAA
jgi:hypothetical protein